MKIHTKQQSHPNKDDDSWFSDIINPNLAVAAIGDGLTPTSEKFRRERRAKLASEAACDMIGGGTSSLLRKMGEQSVRNFIPDLVVQVNDNVLTGGKPTNGHTTFNIAAVNLERRIIEGYNIGDSNVALLFEDGSFSFITPTPKDINPSVKPKLYLGMYPHGGDDFDDCNVKFDLTYFKIDYKNKIRIRTEKRWSREHIDIKNYVIEGKKPARLLLFTDGISNPVTLNEFGSILGSVPTTDPHYDKIVLNQLFAAAAYPYERMLNLLDKRLTEDALVNVIEIYKGNLIANEGIHESRLTTLESMIEVFIDVKDTETGKNMRRDLGLMLKYIDDATMVDVHLNDTHSMDVINMDSSKTRQPVIHGPYIGMNNNEQALREKEVALEELTEEHRITSEDLDKALGVVELQRSVLEETKTELSQLRKTYQESQDELATRKAELDEAREGLEERIGEQLELTQELRTIAQELESKEHEYVALETEVEELRITHQETTTAFSQLQIQYKEAETRIQELVTQLAGSENWISPENHTKAVESKEREVDARYIGYISHSDHRERIREAEEAIQQRYVAQEEELNELKEVHRLKNNEFSTLEATLEGVREDLTEEKRKLITAEETINIYEIRQTEYDARISELEEEISLYENAKARYETRIAEHETAIAEQTEISEEQERTIQDHVRTTGEQSTTIEEQGEKISNLETAASGYEATIAEHERTSERDIGIIRELDQKIIELNTLLEKRYNADSALELLRKELETERQAKEELTGKLETAKSTIGERQEQYDNLEGRYQELEKTISGERVKYKTTEDALKQAEEKLEGYAQVQEDLANARVELEKYVGLEAELTEAKEANERISTALTEAESKLIEYDGLEAQLKELTTAKEESDKALSEAQQKLEDYAEIDKQLIEAQDKLTNATEELERYASIEEQLKELTTAKAEVDNALEKYAGIEEQLEKLTTAKAEVDNALEKYAGIEEQLEKLTTAKAEVDTALERSRVALVDKTSEYQGLIKTHTETTNALEIAREELVRYANIEEELDKLRTTKAGVDAALTQANEKLEDYSTLEQELANIIEAKAEVDTALEISRISLEEKTAALTQANEKLREYESLTEQVKGLTTQLDELRNGYDIQVADLEQQLTDTEEERDARISKDKYEQDVTDAKTKGREVQKTLDNTKIMKLNNEIEEKNRMIESHDEISQSLYRVIERLENKLSQLRVDLQSKYSKNIIEDDVVEELEDKLSNMAIKINYNPDSIFGNSDTYYSNAGIKTEDNNIDIQAEYVEPKSNMENGTVHRFKVSGMLYRRHKKGKKQGEAKGKGRKIEMDCYVREVSDGENKKYEIDTQQLEITAEMKEHLIFSMSKILNSSNTENADTRYASRVKQRGEEKDVRMTSAEIDSFNNGEIYGDMYNTKNSGRNKGREKGPASHIAIKYQTVVR